MERKYTMYKPRAATLINRIHYDNLPIECHEGHERKDSNGDRLVDVLLVYDDPDLVNDLITDIMDDDLPFNLL